MILRKRSVINETILASCKDVEVFSCLESRKYVNIIIWFFIFRSDKAGIYLDFVFGEFQSKQIRECFHYYFM